MASGLREPAGRFCRHKFLECSLCTMNTPSVHSSSGSSESPFQPGPNPGLCLGPLTPMLARVLLGQSWSDRPPWSAFSKNSVRGQLAKNHPLSLSDVLSTNASSLALGSKSLFFLMGFRVGPNVSPLLWNLTEEPSLNKTCLTLFNTVGPGTLCSVLPALKRFSLPSALLKSQWGPEWAGETAGWQFRAFSNLHPHPQPLPCHWPRWAP